MTPPVLYVCAPFKTATPREIDLTMRVRREAVARGWTPVWAPGLLAGLGLSENVHEDRVAALACAVSLVKKSEALVVVGSRVTEGMRLELEEWAKAPRITFVAFDDDFVGLSRVVRTSTLQITAHDWRDDAHARLVAARAGVCDVR